MVYDPGSRPAKVNSTFPLVMAVLSVPLIFSSMPETGCSISELTTFPVKAVESVSAYG